MTKHLQTLSPLPRHDPDSAKDEPPLATAAWLSRDTVLRAIKEGAKDQLRSPIILGQLWEGNHNHLFISDDDRHLVTVAGNRSGKGRGLIIPNLLNYPGSVVCIDPKGENAAVTARYRRDVLKQNVVILDPFGVLKNESGLAGLRGGFNPLEWIKIGDPELIDEVASLADALIIRDNPKDPHWNESARAFLKGIMLFMMATTLPYSEDETGEVRTVNWTLGVVRRLASVGLAQDGQSLDLSSDISAVAQRAKKDAHRATVEHSAQADGRPSLEYLLAAMQGIDAFNGAVAAAGHLLEQMGDKERGGVLSNLRRHTEFLESPTMEANLRESDFDPSTIATTPTTIYLVLPEWRMGTHARWLRLVITSLLQALQRGTRDPNAPATLFILDEFATLEHMQSIERAAGYIAGFGAKLWIHLQDLGQLKNLYAGRWETFLGNAGTLTAFGNVDVTTLEYLSRRLGETEVIRTLQNVSYQGSDTESGAGIGQVVAALMKNSFPSGLLGADSESAQSGYSVSSQPSLQKTALITPDEIARHFAREAEVVLVHLAGQQPFRLNRIRYDVDEPFCVRAGRSPYH